MQQDDFFVCDIFDAVPKGDMASMEHPVFSISTKPDRRIRRYENGSNFIEITPSVRGLATVHDRDVLIFCISQIMAALNRGEAVSQTIRFRAFEMLSATNRPTGGEAYQRLRDTLERLSGTRITTNITTGPKDARIEVTSGFGLIESWEILRRAPGSGRGAGRMVSVAVTLSEWLFRAVQARSVLTLSRDYFRLRKPLERRIYELARKHCGHQPAWRVSVEVLHKKSGSASPRRVFRAMLREMIASDHLPGYRLEEEPGDILCVRPRRRDTAGAGGPVLSAATLEEARARAPGWDVHGLEAEWRAWWEDTGRPRLRAPDRAFLGWLTKRLRDA